VWFRFRESETTTIFLPQNLPMKKILFLAILFISTAVFAQNVDFKALDKYISQTQKDWNIPGLSVGIVKDVNNREVIFKGIE
jgi:phosphoserine aminotransferase